MQYLFHGIVLLVLSAGLDWLIITRCAAFYTDFDYNYLPIWKYRYISFSMVYIYIFYFFILMTEENRIHSSGRVFAAFMVGLILIAGIHFLLMIIDIKRKKDLFEQNV